MTSVFVSYRRSDSSASTGRIADRLQLRFGEKSIFHDVDTIPLGIDFRDYLNERLDQCDVFLAIIGDQWLDARDADGNRRLFDPADNVRLEVATALMRGNIPVIPVLVGKAGVPQEADLPDVLQQLAYRNAIEVRSTADFDGQMSRLITAIERIIERESSGTSAATEAPGPSVETPVSAAASAPAQNAEPRTPATAASPPAASQPAGSGGRKGLIAALVIALVGVGLYLATRDSNDDSFYADEPIVDYADEPVGTETSYPADAAASYASLMASCEKRSEWVWGCEVPAIPDVTPFLDGPCACEGRVLRHLETGLFRCEQLPDTCGGVSFQETLGYDPNPEWYEDLVAR